MAHSAASFANRRTVERFLLNPPAAATIEPAGDCLLVDLSIRGARVRHRAVLEPGTKVRLRFRPAAHTIHVTVHGEVVWSEPIDPENPDEVMTGIQFSEDAAGLRTAIDRLCSSGGAMRIQ